MTILGGLPYRTRPLAVAAVSLALLAGAFAFQHIGGLAPCPLCIVQRWMHVAIILACALAWARPSRATFAIGASASLAAVSVAFFHVGVEAGWWAGLESCSGVGETMTGMSGADLLSTESPAPIVKCSEVAWALFGVSMAGWNTFITALAAQLWITRASAE